MQYQILLALPGRPYVLQLHVNFVRREPEDSEHSLHVLFDLPLVQKLINNGMRLLLRRLPLRQVEESEETVNLKIGVRLMKIWMALTYFLNLFLSL